jgi:hypothetical protein
MGADREALLETAVTSPSAAGVKNQWTVSIPAAARPKKSSNGTYCRQNEAVRRQFLSVE